MSGKMVSFEGVVMPGELGTEGWYFVTVEEVREDPSKSGKPMYTIRFSVDNTIIMFTMWFTLTTDAGDRNEISYSQLMQLSSALLLGTDGEYDLSDMLGKDCGARLYKDGDFIRAGKFVNPDNPAETEGIEWLNERDSDVPF
jgi:hypothetical protein